MKTKIINNITNENIRKIVSGIKKGKIVILPTETVYGICANACDENSVDKIYRVKKRDKSKNLIVLISRLDMLKDIVVEPNKLEKKLIKKYWPGPLTIIFNKKKNSILANNVCGDTVAIRFTSNKLLNKIIEESEVPLVAPSANITGECTGTDINLIIKDFDGKVDYIIDGGNIKDKETSTIVHVIDDEVKVIREGKIKINVK